MKPRKLVGIILAVVLLVGMVAGCATKASNTKSKKITTFNVTYVMPSTQSQFWSVDIMTGVQNACTDIKKQYGVQVNLKTTGPAQESQSDAYIQALENAVSTKPNAIITATETPDATVPVIRDAMKSGIYVNLVNCGVTGNEDSYGTFYSGKMDILGENAANAFLAALDKRGIAKQGVIGMEFSAVNPALLLRLSQFKAVVEEKAPGIKCLDTLYNQNDVNKAQSNVEDQMSANGSKIIGFYGANNTSGDGIGLAIKNAGANAKNYVSVAVDSDSLEIEALKAGTLDAIVCQDPYTQAYDATMNAYEHVASGKTDPKYVDVPSAVVTADNMNQPEFAALLNPAILKEK
jgi:ribose transport system substrate-binding protein